MTNLDHLHSLIAHGAQIGYAGPTGQTIKVSLDESFYTEHLAWIVSQPAITALTFDLYLPGIEEDLALTIWADGHIDSGSKNTMQRILDR